MKRDAPLPALSATFAEAWERLLPHDHLLEGTVACLGEAS